MAYLTLKEQVIAFRATKRFGFSTFFGKIFFGFARFGDDNEYADIYHYKNSAGQRKFVRQLMQWPTNPRTEAQQSHRATFADAVSAWQALDPDQKFSWRKKGQRRMIGGYNAFLSDYMLTH